MAANKTATSTANSSPTLTTSVINGGYIVSPTGPVYYTGIGIGPPGGGGGGYSYAAGGGSGLNTNNIGSWSSQTGHATITAGTLALSGDDADIKINDVSLTDTLKTIQARLNILTPNDKLEKEWNELKALGDQYRKLEAEFAEKSRMWTALKKTE